MGLSFKKINDAIPRARNRANIRRTLGPGYREVRQHQQWLCPHIQGGWQANIVPDIAFGNSVAMLASKQSGAAIPVPGLICERDASHLNARLLLGLISNAC